MNIKLFFTLCYANNSLSSCHLPVTKLVQRENHVCAIISMPVFDKKTVQSYHHFLMSTLNTVLGVGTHVMVRVVYSIVL